MIGRCATCRHWDARRNPFDVTGKTIGRLGECGYLGERPSPDFIDALSAGAEFGPFAFVDDERGDDRATATAYTSPDFGCVQWEARA